ncbi:homocysteine s-methyltransferase [Trichococcus palustris]|uniref:Methionine synthase n=1 Tax=Trichococcus palustris TaxID=140314 RepID=A0A143YJN3_9LACT|nr:homocysteine S-methyltransferase family protein [Trichococcus palustris]CZQ90008.1 homocysteine s-methyltransferase [Trichococcus palustris]SFK98943.1 5-methyltetrahydrofolate--homocysteine methyltransferase [Trichococcus palustris]
MDLLKNIGEGLILFDGAMGTMLQNYGMKPGQNPEALNLEDPELIARIHKEYVEAGAQLLTSNTFGANAYKLYETGYSVKEVVEAAVTLAKKAAAGTETLVALDIGPIGKMMKPIGLLTFEEAYDLFREQVEAGAAAGADVILIETMSDLSEMRAAVLAAKEHSGLPVFATMTFSEDGNTLTGTEPEIMAISLDALGVDVLGVNCSLGPKELVPIIERILKATNTPVMVQANAGIPVTEGGIARYSVTSEDFLESAKDFAAMGVSVIGGCCGTTPAYIKDLKGAATYFRKREQQELGSYVCSAQKKVRLDGKVTLIGERINPSGNKKLKEQFMAGNPMAAVRVAFEQVQNGAEVLDVNTSLPGVDEPGYMKEIIDGMSGLVEAPLQFDSTNPDVLEMALRRYSGVAIVNSVNGEEESMTAIYPIVKKYGAFVVALCLDEQGIPDDAAGRAKVAGKLIGRAKDYGIDEGRLLIDCLVLTASAQQKAVMETLKAMRWVKEHSRSLTTLGLSNVSFGLPFRALINRTYFAMALTSGLDTVIINPGAAGIVDTLKAFNVLAGHDEGAMEYIAYNSDAAPKADGPKKAVGPRTFKDILLEGDKNGIAEATKELLINEEPLSVIDNHIVPALDEVGKLYEKKDIFLPQLIRSAETAGVAFEILRGKLTEGHKKLEPKGTIVMATVKGDIHDIGKNLAKVLLESYGYDVIDLGKDVPIEKIVETVKERKVKLVGLSALMTTTVVSMEETIAALRRENLPVKVMVGGAVLTEKYSKTIGADYYSKDARAGVLVAEEVFRQEK